MHSKLISVILVLLSLTACGGGGGGGGGGAGGGGGSQGPTATTPAAPALTPPATHVPEQPVANTRALQADRAFEFATRKTIRVNVRLGQAHNESAYLAVCRDHGAGIDYADCYLRKPLDSPDTDHSIELPTSTSTLYSAVWYRDLSREPLLTRHRLDAGDVVSIVAN